jgi:hypothetical protein
VSELTKPAPDGWGSVHLLDQAPDRSELAGLRVAELDASAIADKQELMAAISSALEFPDYFGANWDALDECLRDLGWIGAEGYVLVVSGGDAFWRRSPELAGMLVRAWIDAARIWAERGTPFHLVFVR